MLPILSGFETLIHLNSTTVFRGLLDIFGGIPVTEKIHYRVIVEHETGWQFTFTRIIITSSTDSFYANAHLVTLFYSIRKGIYIF